MYCPIFDRLWSQLGSFSGGRRHDGYVYEMLPHFLSVSRAPREGPWRTPADDAGGSCAYGALMRDRGAFVEEEDVPPLSAGLGLREIRRASARAVAPESRRTGTAPAGRGRAPTRSVSEGAIRFGCSGPTRGRPARRRRAVSAPLAGRGFSSACSDKRHVIKGRHLSRGTTVN
jgi:hypothetical protein